MLRSHHYPGHTFLVVAGRISRLEEIGGNRSRIDSRNDNAALAKLLAQGIRKTKYRMFGRRIGNCPGCADFAGHGSHVHNLPASPLQHMRNNGFSAADNAHIVDVHHIGKFLRLHLGKSGKFAVTGVVQQDIDSAVNVKNFSENPLNLCLISNITGVQSKNARNTGRRFFQLIFRTGQ
ncbi:hypothetical protein D3C81_1313790 [compost metagenome]